MSGTPMNVSLASRAERCPGCGAAVGGLEACQTHLDQLAARAYSDAPYAQMYDVAFDAYCMQHVERYCRSATSYAAHLTRLCCGLEHHGNLNVYRAIQRWLNGRVTLVKPTILTQRGTLTIVNVQVARDAQEHAHLVHAWANCVWDAYASQHELARLWLATALRT